MILLASTSRSGRLALSWVSVVGALSAGKLSSCREGAQISVVWTSLLAEDEGLKQSLSQKLLASVVHTLPCVVYDGSQRCYGNTLPGGMDTSPLAGKVPGCLEPKQGLPQKLFEFSLFQKLLASAVHTLTCSDQSWRNPGFFFFYRTSMYPSLLHHISSTYHVFMKYNFK